jgi:hypothetical protein
MPSARQVRQAPQPRMTMPVPHPKVMQTNCSTRELHKTTPNPWNLHISRSRGSAEAQPATESRDFGQSIWRWPREDPRRRRGLSLPEPPVLHALGAEPRSCRSRTRRSPPRSPGARGSQSPALTSAPIWRLRKEKPRTVFAVLGVLPGGDERIRTADLCRAKAALSQLSHVPVGAPPATASLQPPREHETVCLPARSLSNRGRALARRSGAAH